MRLNIYARSVRILAKEPSVLLASYKIIAWLVLGSRKLIYTYCRAFKLRHAIVNCLRATPAITFLRSFPLAKTNSSPIAFPH